MKTRIPTVDVYGPIASHDQACAVYHHKGESAVIDLSRGVFEPSWKAQQDGWRLVQAKSWLQRKVLQIFFGDEP